MSRLALLPFFFKQFFKQLADRAVHKRKRLTFWMVRCIACVGSGEPTLKKDTVAICGLVSTRMRRVVFWWTSDLF